MNDASPATRLLIGVTGHRDLLDVAIEETRTNVRNFFNMLDKEFPHLRVVLYNGLAEGADQLVAEVALDLKIPFIAVLPMPLELYRNDFIEGTAAAKQFEFLLLHAEDVLTLGLLENRENNQDTAQCHLSAEQRNDQYAALGDFLAVRTQMLLALWNGEDSAARGGTSWVVQGKLGGRLSNNRLDQIETGLVYIIPTRRKSNPIIALREQGFTANDNVRVYLEAIKEINVFNKLVSKATSFKSEALTSFMVADHLALQYQRYLLSFRTGLFVSALTLVLTFSIYSELYRSPSILIVYLATMLVGATIWKIQRSMNIERRFFDFRTLAEALRIQTVWSSANLRHSVADEYLRKHRGELHWIRLVLRGYARDADIIAMLTRRRDFRWAGAKSEDKDLLESRSWILDQKEYFKRTAARKAFLIERLTQAAQSLFVIGLCSAFGIVISSFIVVNPDVGAIVERYLVFIMAAAPACAGLIGAWIQQSAILDEIHQSNHMSRLFRSALADWDEPHQQAYRENILYELGREAIHDNADWLLLHRLRPLEPPLPGG